MEKERMATTDKPHRDFAIYRAGMFHYVRQHCPLNNKTAMRFLFGLSIKSVHRTSINYETAMQFLNCMMLILPFEFLQCLQTVATERTYDPYVPRIESKHQI